jgi:hypothetical protein
MEKMLTPLESFEGESLTPYRARLLPSCQRPSLFGAS